MSDIELGEQTLSIKTTTGGEYLIADPLDLMLWLEEEAPKDGVFNREGIAKIKAKIMEVSGVPAMTASQVVKFVTGLKEYAEELKKNIGLSPNSSTGTDATPSAPRNAPDSIRISPGSRPQKSSLMPPLSGSPSPQNQNP